MSQGESAGSSQGLSFQGDSGGGGGGGKQQQPQQGGGGGQSGYDPNWGSGLASGQGGGGGGGPQQIDNPYSGGGGGGGGDPSVPGSDPNSGFDYFGSPYSSDVPDYPGSGVQPLQPDWGTDGGDGGESTPMSFRGGTIEVTRYRGGGWIAPSFVPGYQNGGGVYSSIATPSAGASFGGGGGGVGGGDGGTRGAEGDAASPFGMAGGGFVPPAINRNPLYARGGGVVPPAMSPSGGMQTDDVPAVVNQTGGAARLNADEFVIPRDVALWKGQEFFQKFIQKARQDKSGAPARAQTTRRA